MKKIVLTTILALITVFAMGVVSVYASNDTVLSSQSLTVDGKKVSCEVYNIEGYNYFKLRDLAMLLNDTGSQFSVNWNKNKNRIYIVKGESYNSVGGELVIGEDKSKTAIKSSQTIMINNKLVKSISVYNIGGNNYFKLRDMGKHLYFNVTYDEETNIMNVKSRIHYNDDIIDNEVQPVDNSVPTDKKTEYKQNSKGIQAKDFKSMTNKEIVDLVGPMFTEDQKKTGILASVSMAQFILESGYGKSTLATEANNCFGMKANLSSKTWSGSAWDGVSVYNILTKEENLDGSVITVSADFRKYDCVEDSIADHSAYLLGSKKSGGVLRYDGVQGCKDYRKAIQIIKDGGYATSLTYVDSLCNIIEKLNLTKYDIDNNDTDE